MVLTRGGKRRRQHGAVAVETAVILPILLLLLFGIVEFGLLFHRLQGVHAASREAARFGSLEDITVEQIEERAVAAAPPFIDTASGHLRVRVFRGVNDVEGPQLTLDEKPCDSDFDDPNLDVYVRVELEVTDPDQYGVVIPMWGSFAFRHPSTGVFACEY